MTETRVVDHGTAVSKEDRDNKSLRIREAYVPRGDGVFVDGERVQAPTLRGPTPKQAAGDAESGQDNSDEGSESE